MIHLKKILPFWTVLGVFLAGSPVAGQSGGIYTLHLTDKKGSPYTLDRPEDFLSPRALQRRAREHIQLTPEDLPVSPAYLDTLRSLGTEIYCRSKWFNTVTVRISDTSLLDSLKKLDFIDSIRLVKPGSPRKSLVNKWQEKVQQEELPGYLQQLSMLNGLTLHDKGLTGQGVLIAVLDAGFCHVNELPAFDSLRAAGRIAGTRDMVARNNDVWDDHTHGMNVLSILAGIIPGTLRGAAPGASYWLIRTEDVFSEYPVEEEYWLAGAELADSAGADIITSSLGYYTFDDPRFDHTYADMNGRTTVAARAAVMAARRGIIVVNSAGNERNKAWYYIITPADADSILAVGAVDATRQPSSFTSSGPSSDGRVKPDVAALGVGVFVQLPNGTVGQGSGTSFSAPLITGMTACLRQAFPNKPAQEIIRAIREAASRYNNPDNLVGYGIPDMKKAWDILYFTGKLKDENKPLIFPNPCRDDLTIAIATEKDGDITVTACNATGAGALSTTTHASPGIHLLHINVTGLAAGTYFLKISYDGKTVTLPVIKIN